MLYPLGNHQPLNRNSMTMYLLLRNNKQSGPYSLDELKTMGLKAYDLVWLEGRSAAWRYPSELPELSAFAPAVEEQPFDRFYKKPSPAEAVSTTAMATAAAPASAFSPRPVAETSDEPSRTSGKRIIYVTMPAGRTPVPLRENSPIGSKGDTAASAIVSAPAFSPAAATAATASGSAMAAPAAAPRTAPVTAIPDYTAEPMEAIPSRTGYLPRRQPRRGKLIVRSLTIGVSVLALLAAGIIIGLSLNKDSLHLPQKVVAKLPPADNGRSIVHNTAQHLPASAIIPPAAGNKTDSPVVIVDKPVEIPVHTVRQIARNGNRPSGIRQKEQSSPPLTGTRLVPIGRDSAATGQPVTHREAVHRTDVTGQTDPDNANKEAVRTALAAQVAVGANSYSVGAFGGINDLQLTVTNRSVYPLDLVIVEVQYIQANKKIFKTENLYFHGIGAGSALMHEAPRSSRGVKVQYRITAISSKELGLS
jgi:hypothetical protein